MKELDFLFDISLTGKVRPWPDKARKSRFLAEIYKEIDLKKAIRLNQCASTLTFRVAHDEKKKLERADFCRVRLCPMCVWRRTLKVFGQTSAIMQELKKQDKYEYIFISLTAENCTGKDLSATIDLMMNAWHKFVGYAQFRRIVKGFYRGFEVTHNLDQQSDSFDTFHPHFHCIFAVDKKYFSSRDYLSHREWLELWQKALKVEYEPWIFIKRVRGNTAKAVAEIAKYAVKDGDYIIPNDIDMTIKTVKILDEALDKRRFVSFGGVFKETHQKLNLDNPEDGDLVLRHKLRDMPDYRLVTYIWHSGYRQYVKSE